MNFSLEDFLLRIAATITAVAAISAFVWFFIGPRIRAFIVTVAAGSKAAQQVAVETKPNGGNSVHDYARRAATASEKALLTAETAASAANDARSHTGQIQAAVDVLRSSVAELIAGAGTIREAVNDLQRAGASRDEAIALIRTTLDEWKYEDKIRAEAYQSALMELGIELDPPPKRDINRRDRAEDR